MFSSWLKKSRRSLGLTQRELGRQIGVGGSAVAMWERGKRVPGPKNAAKLRAFYAARRVKMPLPPQRPGPTEEERFCEEVRRIIKGRG